MITCRFLDFGMMDAKKRDMEKLCALVQTCHKCVSLTKSRNKIVNGYGDLNASVLFVGEAPGRLGADITGIPFTRDKSGKLLQSLLYQIGMNNNEKHSDNPLLKNAYITNVIRCNPRNLKNNNATPKSNEIFNCNDYLKMEIKIINPLIIVPLGLTASRVFLGNNFTGKCFGFIFFIQGTCIFPLWHPSFIMRGGGVNKMDIKKYSKYFLMIDEILKYYSENK